MKFTLAFNPKQQAERWVSIIVLLGCILITAGIIYIWAATDALGQAWEDKSNTLYKEEGL